MNNKPQKCNSDSCCSTTDQHRHGEEHSHEHHHHHAEGSKWKIYQPIVLSAFFFLVAIGLDKWLQPLWFTPSIRFVIYLLAYLPVGFPVVVDALRSIRNGDVFSEFFLMVIATLGAFAIGEYPEAVAVMLFYALGEIFQSLAVSKARSNVKSLLDQRPDEVSVWNAGELKQVKAVNITPGEIIQIKPGEKLALDGVLLSEQASFNTAALSGESIPSDMVKGDKVLAGMINLNTLVQVEVSAAYQDSKLSKILKLVQEASTHKAPTELFIRKFARIYTPIVVFMAIAICLLPYFFSSDYQFSHWLYRSLIFLVVSCPCALVISIPLGYFGGIGAASRNGILVKGGNYLDILAKLNHVVADKTGTLTKGVFKVKSVHINPSFDEQKILSMLNVVERGSSHPIATAIHEYVGEVDKSIDITEQEEIAGHGLRAKIDGQTFLAGNFRLLDRFHVDYPSVSANEGSTLLALAINQEYVGYIAISDEIKAESALAVKQLNDRGVLLTILSGDKNSVVQDVAKQLGVTEAFGDLLPEDKVDKFKAIKQQHQQVVFVGDGVNDAPVLALSDVGIAMGGLGSDAAIETADVVIQDDNPMKIPIAIAIGKQTRKVVWQNILFAFAVKAIVLVLGAGGLATMWEAVFADVGVALLAIFNAIRIQQIDFSKT